MSNSATSHSEPEESAVEEESSVDELFDVLRKSRRRAVLSILAGRQSPTNVQDLAHTIAVRENDVAPASLSESTIREVHVTLHHVHLPKLDEASLIDYDREEQTVETTNADAVPIDIE